MGSLSRRCRALIILRDSLLLQVARQLVIESPLQQLIYAPAGFSIGFGVFALFAAPTVLWVGILPVTGPALIGRTCLSERTFHSDQGYL